MIGRMIRAVRDKAVSSIAGAMMSEYLQTSSRGENGSPAPDSSPQNGSTAAASENAAKTVEMQQIERLEYRCKRFFDVIVSIENERDTWRKMFYEEGAAHLSAQYKYEEAIVNGRNMVKNAVDLINQYRKLANEPSMENPFKDLAEPPIGQVAAFEDLLRRLQNDSPKSFDYVQQAIAEKKKWAKEDEKPGAILDPEARPYTNPNEQWRSTT